MNSGAALPELNFPLDARLEQDSMRGVELQLSLLGVTKPLSFQPLKAVEQIARVHRSGEKLPQENQKGFSGEIEVNSFSPRAAQILAKTVLSARREESRSKANGAGRGTQFQTFSGQLAPRPASQTRTRNVPVGPISADRGLPCPAETAQKDDVMIAPGSTFLAGVSG